MILFRKFFYSKSLSVHRTELKTVKILKIGCFGHNLCAWEVLYSHCSKLGRNRP
jgi:hypothetical protein